MSKAPIPRIRLLAQYSMMLILGFAAFGLSYAVSRATIASAKAAKHSVPQKPSRLPPGMIWLGGGEFVMGSDAPDASDDERPPHRVRVPGFWIDTTEVTNRKFRDFVNATRYVTTAEKNRTADEILAQSPAGTAAPAPELLVPGSLVFTPLEHEVPLDDVSQWWKWTPGANWRHPEGPDSDITGRDDHPVVHVSWEDATSYALWAKKRLPTEAEWEFAARGGLTGARFVWGNDSPEAANSQANLWTGQFPHNNTAEDKFVKTAPVQSFPANGFGLYDAAGNVWEWCSDWYAADAYQIRSKTEVTLNPQGPIKSHDPKRPSMPLRSQRGGSFLCHSSYCTGYRPSARQGCDPKASMSHVGFRCVMSANPKFKP